MKYRPEIDGLRAIAVLSVIFFHSGFTIFSGGYIGVDVFFVISGFLITNIIYNACSKNSFSFRDFYTKRVRRIAPMLVFTTFFASCLSCFTLYPNYLISFGKSVLSIIGFSSNFYFWSERGYFGGSTELKPLVHTWSLSVEEQFYFIYPILLNILHKKFKGLIITLITITILSFIASIYLTSLHFETAFYLPLTRAHELLIGGLTFHLINSNKIPYSKSNSNFAHFAGLILIIGSIFTLDEKSSFPGYLTLCPCLGAAFLLLPSKSNTLIHSFLSNKYFRYVGLRSYSLYLLHQPIFAVARHLDIFDKHKYLFISLVFVASHFTYRFIETPFRKKNIYSNKKIWHLFLLSNFALLLIGYTLIASNGLIFRYNQNKQKIFRQYSELSTYNPKLFDSLINESFSQKDIKVLITGDSYAKDWLNLIMASGKFGHYSFSTKQINSECGNLFLSNQTKIFDYIPNDRLLRCQKLGWYEDKITYGIAEEADEIWLVNSWRDWVIPFLPETIENLQNEFNCTVRVFGIKQFGEFSIKEIFQVKQNEKPEFKIKLENKYIEIDHRMDKVLDYYPYYYSILKESNMGNEGYGYPFTNDGLLISTDGGHLTKAGAREVSKRLSHILDQIYISKTP
jgi:peptidoglycan/LPS O-acetylase OafA/YrhL